MSERRRNQDETLGQAAGDCARAVTDQVHQFYEAYRFPGVRPLDQDGLILRRRLAGCRPGPGEDKPRWRVLDAGCGTGNTTISLARRFPNVDFLGVDLSAGSLSVAEKTAKEQGLPNIRFRQWNLLDSGMEEGSFDLVLCLGVLHHTAGMLAVLSNLREEMTDNGRLYLWVYGQHGRYRHSLNRRLLSMLLAAGPSVEDPVALAREFLRSGGQGSVFCDLLGTGSSSSLRNKALTEPAWIADQLLNPNEILLTMESLLALLRNAQLEIEQWLGLPEKPYHLLGSEMLLQRYEQLSPCDQLIALDLLLKPERYFLVLRRLPEAEVLAR
jgi:SAM-dependent methyltransferase